MKNLLENIKSYFEHSLQDEIALINKSENKVVLDSVKSFDLGFKDLSQGLRNYPAFFVYNNGRTLDGFFTREHVVIRLVLNASDLGLLETKGYLYMDALERAIRKDRTLGGSILYGDEADITSVVIGNVYIITVEQDVTLDRKEWEYGNS